LNIVPGTIKGAQISGLINYATKVHGVQFGFLNIADSVKGVPIGFLSIVGKGLHQLEISADELFYTNIAFRTGVSAFYNILTVGANPSTLDEENALWSFGYGVGTAPRLSRRLSLNFDLTTNQILKGEKFEDLNMLNKLSVGVEFRPARKLGVYAGATLNAYYTEVTNPIQFADLFAANRFTPDVTFEKTYSNDVNVKMWWGAKVGVRFL
jgi:hypothetical protein